MNYIMHYGVGHDKGGHSGRYKWGTGERPYQSEGGGRRRTGAFEVKSSDSSSVDDRINAIKNIGNKIKSSISGKIAEKKEANELKKQRANEVKQVEEAAKHQQRLMNAVDKGRSDANKEYQSQKEERNDNDEYEQEKARVLRDGTASELVEWAPRLSNQELQAAYSRLQTKQNLERLLPKEPSTFDKINKAFGYLETANKWGSTMLNTYNNVSKVAEIFDIDMPGSKRYWEKKKGTDKDNTKQNQPQGEKKKDNTTNTKQTTEKKENKINPYVPIKKRNKHEKLVQETYEKNAKEATESLKNRLQKMDERNKQHQEKINNIIKEGERSIKAKQIKYKQDMDEYRKKADKKMMKQLKSQWKLDDYVRKINRNK